VSRLFTSINYDEVEEDKYWDQLPTWAEDYVYKEEKYYKVAGFKFRPKSEIYIDLDDVNEIIYNR